MDRNTARQIGKRLAIKSALIGLLIAYVIFGGLLYSWGMKLVKAILWIADVEFAFHLLVGAFGLLAMAYFFGQLAAIDILVKKRNELWTGIKYGLIILISGTLIGSSVGFIQEGVDNIGKFGNPFYDYYFKPMYWIVIFGIVPVIIVGLWFGRQIKKQELKKDMA
ncbi:hypothetical protein [Pontibacter harenae]|uniref:hypothetical protein n=1 Tax=Pontibacter harenae TaxID=2894083 RepID=UPI001E626881|nr:hypothetical protein [Pontibacter harenae]MCC9168910.1 hypothetical protein [Pontibacter harenae]